ncbi:hypothetical protein GBFDFA_00625 [Edwardsiella anguillarum]|nr:hypothetical protein PBOPBF_00625 [Edwardsiella anguillarum]BET82604.1 hypothetical protein GHNJMD_00625 [Edwardsiella anguillarum]BET86033.1 hypothetical protein GBFDFA_00625 [Edwardsiella anguillarum]BET89458.1 hypothetical protein BIKEJJ_00625 [Edwardsiella anguillarum]
MGQVEEVNLAIDAEGDSFHRGDGAILQAEVGLQYQRQRAMEIERAAQQQGEPDDAHDFFLIP